MPHERLTSPSNPLLKEIRRAQDQGGLTTRGWLIAEGPHLVEETVRSGLHIACLIVAAGVSIPAAAQADRIIEVPEPVYRSISGTTAPQNIMALAEPPQHGADAIYEGQGQRNALVLVLDGVQDPGNAGAIARSAEAFGASGLVFLEGTANPMNPKALRASAGSLFRIPFVHAVDLASLHAGPLFSGVASLAAPAAWDCDLAQVCGIVVGNEGRGVSAEALRRSQPVRIPTCGVESLNAAVAASVLLYEAARQRRIR